MLQTWFLYSPLWRFKWTKCLTLSTKCICTLYNYQLCTCSCTAWERSCNCMRFLSIWTSLVLRLTQECWPDTYCSANWKCRKNLNLHIFVRQYIWITNIKFYGNPPSSLEDVVWSKLLITKDDDDWHSRSEKLTISTSCEGELKTHYTFLCINSIISLISSLFARYKC